MNFMIAGGWLWSFLMSSPPLLGWGIYLPESNGMRYHIYTIGKCCWWRPKGSLMWYNDLSFRSCVPGWKSVNGRGYNSFLLIFAFFIPLLIMILTSVSKYRYLNKVNIHKKAPIIRKYFKNADFTCFFYFHSTSRVIVLTKLKKEI